MKAGKWFFALAAVMTILLTGACESITDSIFDGASSGAEKAVSEHMEQAVYKSMAPRDQIPAPSSPMWGNFMAMQAQVVFSYAFSAGGLWLGQTAYQPGEWTKFEMMMKDEDTPVLLERAFLKKEDNGNEWWRVGWTQGEDSWIYEGLMSPSEGKLLRLRAKDAEGNDGEIPVSNQTIYIPPTEVTNESIQGATVGKESLSTPAGTFQTEHVVYMATASEGKVEWWITDKVPGGVAKYLINHKSEGVLWTSTLKEKGTGAVSVLSSF